MTCTCSFIFHSESFEGRVYAARDIRKGEIIRHQTANALLTLPRAIRMHAMYTRTRLLCDCSACSLSPAAAKMSDQNRIFIGRTIEKLAAKQPVPLKTVELAINAAEVEELLRQAGDIKYLAGLQQIKVACFQNFSLEGIEQSIRWLRQHVKTLILWEGSDSPYVKEKQDELAQIESRTAAIVELKAQPLQTSTLVLGLATIDSLFPNLANEK